MCYNQKATKQQKKNRHVYLETVWSCLKQSGYLLLHVNVGFLSCGHSVVCQLQHREEEGQAWVAKTVQRIVGVVLPDLDAGMSFTIWEKIQHHQNLDWKSLFPRVVASIINTPHWLFCSSRYFLFVLSSSKMVTKLVRGDLYCLYWVTWERLLQRPTCHWETAPTSNLPLRDREEIIKLI